MMAIKLPREYVTAILMAAVSGVMLLALLGEWVHYRSQRQDITERTAVKPVPPEQNPEAPPVEPKAPALEAYDEMINRPLFIQGRRPPAEDEPEAAAEAPEPKTPLNAKLMGVVLTPGAKTALFVDPQGKYKRGRKNTVIDGWKVFEIKEDRVVMEQGGEHKDLMLIKPKAKPPGPATPQKKTGKAIVTGPGQSNESSDEESGDELDDTDTSDEDESETTDEEDTGEDESTEE